MRAEFIYAKVYAISIKHSRNRRVDYGTRTKPRMSFQIEEQLSNLNFLTKDLLNKMKVERGFTTKWSMNLAKRKDEVN